jgi:hypothetical protein
VVELGVEDDRERIATRFGGRDRWAMTRWMRPHGLESRQRDRFDPIRAEARHGLAPERSLALWARVWADASDGAGRIDEEEARRRFDEITARLSARGGPLRPEVGGVTRAGAEVADGARTLGRTREPGRRAPGRDTAVLADARRCARSNDRARLVSCAVRGDVLAVLRAA